MKKIFPYKCLWQASLLTRKVGKDAVPIDISKFKAIKGNIGLHGYRRVRRESKSDVRAYRKDTYGITFVFINFQDHAIEARTETWAGLMALCSEFDLIPYRTA
jgi:hypothetical protein